MNAAWGVFCRYNGLLVWLLYHKSSMHDESEYHLVLDHDDQVSDESIVIADRDYKKVAASFQDVVETQLSQHAEFGVKIRKDELATEMHMECTLLMANAIRLGEYIILVALVLPNAMSAPIYVPKYFAAPI